MALAYFLLQLQFWFPIWVIFLLEHDISLNEIVVADIVYWVTIVLLEFPMGVISDRIGRRHTFFIGAIIGSVAYFLMLQIHDFPSLILSWVIWGLFNATVSGTDNAYIYELIVEIGLKDRAKYILGYFGALRNFALVFSMIIAGYLYTLDMDLPIILNSIAAVLSGSAILLLPQVKSRIVHTPVDQVKSILNLLKNRVNFRYILLFMAFLYTFIYSATLLFQPLLEDINVPIAQFGLIFATFPVFAVIGGLFAGKIADLLGVRTHIVINLLLIFLGTLTIGILPGLYAIIGIFLVYFSYNLLQPILLDFVNRSVENDLRATTLSLANLISSLGLMIGRPGIVILSNLSSIQFSYVIWAVVGVIFLLLPLLRGVLTGVREVNY